MDTSIIFPKDQPTLNNSCLWQAVVRQSDKININKSLNIFFLHSRGKSCPLPRDYAFTMNLLCIVIEIATQRLLVRFMIESS
jgi:hypothetical protein